MNTTLLDSSTYDNNFDIINKIKFLYICPIISLKYTISLSQIFIPYDRRIELEDFIKNIKKPLDKSYIDKIIIVYGGNDKITPEKNSEKLFDILRNIYNYKINIDIFFFSNKNHSQFNDKNLLDYIT